ncbi:MAG: aminopeptidase P family protein [Candidatus Omnitrophica bacterium]|nr:aminopeptidase P family protein [Candidatus Omnitrophota bacterium]
MNPRLVRFKDLLRKRGIGAFLVTDPKNIYYLSGFRDDTSCLLITGDRDFIITDFRYSEDARSIPGFTALLTGGRLDAKNILKKTLNDLEINTLGFESSHLSYNRANILKTYLKKDAISLKAADSGLINRLRVCKDRFEIDQIKRCVQIAKRSLASLKKELRAGLTERLLARILENRIRDNGGDGCSFETIAASGVNSSRPHARPQDRPVEKNRHIIIDFGVMLNWYNCDLTRVVFLGKIEKLFTDIYNVCIGAQAAAIKKIKPGARAGDIDEAARRYISRKGFGKFFGHALGHGVGLDVHERPRLCPKANDIIRPNMIFTVEPGIYLEGRGGVRVEDMVLVTEKGCEVLSYDIPK